MSLHVVSNGKLSFEEFTNIAVTVNPFVDYFHIREKQKTAKELFEGISFLLQTGIPAEKIIVNDRIDVTVALGLGGVQLAYHSLPINVVRKRYDNFIIGCSTHSLKEVQNAENEGATFALLGHIFPTSSKHGLEARGCELIKEISCHTTIPIIAIGGISPENTSVVLDHGASGIAVMSGILEHKNPLYATQQYKLAITEWKEAKHEETL
jgi:thiazole tautomerase (transcriptional regulator TenI)